MPLLRFTKRQRVTKRSEYDMVHHNGRQTGSAYFRAFALPGDREMPARLGISVSRSFKNATDRNRLKRRIREIFRLHQQELVKGQLIVVIVKPSSADLDYQEMEQEILRLFMKLNLVMVLRGNS